MTKQTAINRLIAWFVSQLGYHEGANNYNKYAPLVKELVGWLPQNQPWCDTITDAGFISVFGLQKASEMTYQPIGHGSVACRYSARCFEGAGAFYKIPERGDVIFFYYDGAINHMGIVTDVTASTVKTIEGNTSDMVARREYSRSDSRIAGYGRPKWEAVEDESDEQPVQQPAQQPERLRFSVSFPLLQHGDTGEDVRAVQILLIGRGYTCGGWGADGDFGNATRQAVENFQTENNLEADGIVGSQTLSKLLGI